MKRMTAVLLVLIMAVGLCACSVSGQPQTELAVSQNPEAETGSQTGLPDKPVEIELWTDFNIDEAVLQGVIDKFEEAYKEPGYTITLDKFAGSDRATKLSLGKESKTLPALFLSAWFVTADEVHQGNVLCIDDLVSEVKDDLYPAIYEATLVDGKSYMIGLYQSYFGLLYNADALRKAGLDAFIPEDKLEVTEWTLDDFEQKILPALAAQCANTERYPLALYAASSQADVHMMNWLSMYGGSMWSDGTSTAGSDANVVKALETMKAWTDRGYTNTDVATKDGTEVVPDLQNQLCAISFGQYTDYTATKNKIDSGEIEEFDLRIAAVPVKDNGLDRSLMADYVYGATVLNNGKEDEIAVAKEFLRWLLADTESLTAINITAMPCFKSITEATKEEYPIYASYEKVEDTIWDFTGNAPGFVETRKDLFPALQSVYSGEKTAAEALAAYSEKANRVIEEYTENSMVLN